MAVDNPPTPLCQCGCGEPASLAQRHNPKLGHVKGQPVRFLPGHHRRGAYGSLETRFRSRVDVRGPDDCWEWTGARVPWGYGSIYDGNTRLSAHRLAWEFAHDQGPIPYKLWVLHHCDNPGCCNPKHLFLGTQRDNDDDRTRKGRSRNQHS